MADTIPMTPSTAERIRSTFIRAGGATVAVDGVDPCRSPVHHLLDDDSLLVAVPTGGPTLATVSNSAGAGVEAVLELADYAPLPLREPVRSLVWISGRLQEVPGAEVRGLLDQVARDNPDPVLLQVNSTGDAAALSLLRVKINSVVVADGTGAEAVTVGALLAARPDPFSLAESGWLQHLESVHGDIVDRLAARLPVGLRRGRVRPLGLDRYGLRLRIEKDEGDQDVRLPFAKPVDDATGLSQAIRLLMGCPFLNGLRARQR